MIALALFWFFPRPLGGVFSSIKRAGTRLAHKRRFTENDGRQWSMLRERGLLGIAAHADFVLLQVWLMGRHEEGEIITAGFDSRSAAVSKLMGFLSGLDWVLQKSLSTSLMAVFERGMSQIQQEN